jgi:hypothetical protein
MTTSPLGTCISASPLRKDFRMQVESARRINLAHKPREDGKKNTVVHYIGNSELSTDYLGVSRGMLKKGGAALPALSL